MRKKNLKEIRMGEMFICTYSMKNCRWRLITSVLLIVNTHLNTRIKTDFKPFKPVQLA